MKIKKKDIKIVVEGMVPVIAWTKEKGQFYDYVKRSQLEKFIDMGYVVAIVDWQPE